MNANKNHIQTAGSSAHIMYYKIAVTKTLSTEKLLWKLPIIDIPHCNLQIQPTFLSSNR